MPIQIRDPQEWASYCWKQKAEGRSIGFVPTMGALHAGHMSLVQRSLQENDLSCMSIFVNPAQFNQQEDLESYPRTVESDLKLAEELGVDAVFLPDASAMYPDAYTYSLEEKTVSRIMEGEFRPGHFNGVLTVVMKLLLLTGADRAYFGEKDYQQYVLIRKMAEAFFLKSSIGTEILVCPVVREPDGLAMSSRNTRLTADGRELAGRFAQIFRTAATAEEAERRLKAIGIEVEYIRDSSELSAGERRRFAAVSIDGVRLIDTMAIAEAGEMK